MRAAVSNQCGDAVAGMERGEAAGGEGETQGGGGYQQPATCEQVYPDGTGELLTPPVSGDGTGLPPGHDSRATGSGT